MASQFILALDQGTTSSRAILFDHAGKVRWMAQKEFPQIFSSGGRVEHDAEEIWNSQFAVAREVLQRAKLVARDVAAIGITNQRESQFIMRLSGRIGGPRSFAISSSAMGTSGWCRRRRGW